MKKALLSAMLIFGLPLAQAQTTIESPALTNEVSVYTDANGIPTIVGEIETDVSFVQGYLHARDRFFQMDYLRRVASGTLAELFGQAALENDITLRTLGLRRAAWSSYTELTAKELAWLKSYTDGVNHYLATNPLPPEYGALELTMAEPWSSVDSLVIGKLLAFQLSFDSSLSDISNTIRIGTYQAVGEAVGFDGTALFLQDLNFSIPVDGRVSIPDFFAEAGIIIPEDMDAAKKVETGNGIELGDVQDSPKQVNPESIAGNLLGVEDLGLYGPVREQPSVSNLSRGADNQSLGDLEGAAEMVAFNGADLSGKDIPKEMNLETVFGELNAKVMPTVDSKLVEMAKNYRDSVANLPFLSETRDFGSNWWAVSGEYTESGYPLFANDPHLGLDIPPIFMNENLVVRDEEVAVSGVVFAGAPVNAQACNLYLCWGSTVNPMDVTDVFQDPIVVNNFGLPTHTVFKGQKERILYAFQSYFVNVLGNETPDTVVRANVPYDGGGITFIVPRRNFGPIVEVLGDSALSVQYTGWGPTFELSTFRAWTRADSLEDFEKGLRDFAFGSQNFLYVDVDGNIAYFVGGEMPLRADLQTELAPAGGIPPWFIRDGSGALNHEWLITDSPQEGQATPYALIPREEMPQRINPPWGYLANANNDPVGTTLDGNPLNQLRPGGNGLYYLNTSYADLRMGRIDRVLQDLVAAGDATIEDMKALQANNELLDAELLLPFLLLAFENATAEGAWEGLGALAADEGIQEAMGRLAEWDFSTPTGIVGGFDPGGDSTGASNQAPSEEQIANSVAATIYSVWRGQVIANTIDATLTAVGLGDELPSSELAWRALVNQLRLFPLTNGIAASGLSYFNAPGAPDKAASRDAVLLSSLADALDLLASDEFAPAFANSTNQEDYRWGKLHRVVFRSPLNVSPFNVPAAGGFSNVGEGLPGVARAGGFNAVDASSHSARADSVNGFMFGSGAARRNVATLAPSGPIAEEIIPGGRSGFFMSPFYTNQLRKWLVNEYLPLNIGEDAAIESSATIQVFAPAQ